MLVFSAASLLCLISPAGGQVLVPKRYAGAAAIGGQIGDVAGAFGNYNDLRNSHKLRLAQIRGEMSRTTDPALLADLERELAYWENVDQYSRDAERMALESWGIYGAKDFDQFKLAILDYLQRPDYYKEQIALNRRITNAMIEISKYLTQVEEMDPMKAPVKAREMAPDILHLSTMSRALCYARSKDKAFQDEVAALHAEGKIVKCQPFQFSIAYTDPLVNMSFKGRTLEDSKRGAQLKKDLAVMEAALAEKRPVFEAADRELKPKFEKVQSLMAEYNKLRYSKEGAGSEAAKAKYAELVALRNEVDPPARQNEALRVEIQRIETQRDHCQGQVKEIDARKIYFGIDSNYIAATLNYTPQEEAEWLKVPSFAAAGKPAPAFDGLRKETATPSPGPAARLDEAGIVSAMKKSIASGGFEEAKENQVTEWLAQPDEEYNGESFQMGKITYERETVFGMKKFTAFARIQNGAVVRWISKRP